ncbi:MAG TPA: toll/interleukin-1 receptor domain-containing protein [Thermoanaerobaculia bacterium]|nr:toll/interleukin-1 receptor domain-containing protein [Thermoanaerobaculia bacterium]
MFNLFISHRGADMKEAERLAGDLRARGHLVWLDLWEIQVGDSIIGKINEGLEGAAYLILCYSDQGVLAPWMGREWMSALARQLNGRGIRLLPARLTGGRPPAILEDIRYADLVKDWDSGVAELLTAIR